MLISIFASIWKKNLWDELILKNQIEILRMRYLNKNTKFLVFSYDHKNPFYKRDYIEYKPYFPDNIKNLKYIFKNISSFFCFVWSVIKSDLIVFGWGWLFFDWEVWKKTNSLPSLIFRKRLVGLLFKKVCFFRVWVYVKDKKNTKALKKLFKNALEVSVRDLYSQNVLKKAWIESSLEQDPVFFDRDKKALKKSIIWKIDSYNFDMTKIKEFDFENKTVGIAFRKGFLAEKSNMSLKIEEWKLREIVNYIVKSSWKVILLPHSFSKDDIYSDDYSFLKDFSGVNIDIKDNMQEVYNVYKQKDMDICFSMRLHSAILCHVYEIPFIWVSYSRKTDDIFHTMMREG